MGAFFVQRGCGRTHLVSEGREARRNGQNKFIAPLLKSAPTAEDIEELVTGDVVSNVVPVEGVVAGDVAGAEQDISETNLVAKKASDLVSVGASKSADFVATHEEAEVEPQGSDAWELPPSITIPLVVQVVVSEGQSSNPTQTVKPLLIHQADHVV